MKIDVLTLFPAMIEGVTGSSILGKAQEKGVLEVRVTDFREFSTNKHRTVDDYPYGGGGGMVLKPEPLFAAVESMTNPGVNEASETAKRKPRVILMCPQGERYTQRKAEELAKEEHLILVCGHYEGYDERIREHLITDELSLGDFVLTGGEIAALAVIDSVARLLPGVLGNESSAVTDSYSTGLLEYPHYTRPPDFRGWKVPDVLVSGDHAKIDEWRRRESLRRTLERRPDLLDAPYLLLDKKDRKWLEELRQEQNRTYE